MQAHVVAPIATTVTFRDSPRGSVSAGVLISTLGKRQLGSQAVRTGTDTNGAVTFTNRIREIETSDMQVVPFSFFNLNVAGGERTSLNVTGGIGLNTNNAAKQVEYFVGPSLGINGFFVQGGAHIGRRQELANGFAIDDVIPDKYPGVPLARTWRTKFALAVTYKIPLPK